MEKTTGSAGMILVLSFAVEDEIEDEEEELDFC